MLRWKFIYFCLFVGYGCLTPYLSLYYKIKLGFSSTEIGVLSSILPLLGIFMTPIWSYLADAYNALSKLLGTAAVMSCVILIPFLFLPQISSDFRFVCCLGLLIAFGVFYSPLSSLLDSLLMRKIDEKMQQDASLNKTKLYGRQRMFGSIAFGLAACITANLFKPSITTCSFTTIDKVFYMRNLTQDPVFNATVDRYYYEYHFNVTSDPNEMEICLTEVKKLDMSVLFLGWIFAVGVCFPIFLFIEDIIHFFMNKRFETNKKNYQQISNDQTQEIEKSSLIQAPASDAPQPVIERKQEKQSIFKNFALIGKISEAPTCALGSLPFFICFIFFQGMALSMIGNYLFLVLTGEDRERVMGIASLVRVSLEIIVFYNGGVQSLIKSNDQDSNLEEKKIFDWQDRAKISQVMSMRMGICLGVGLTIIRQFLYFIMLTFNWNIWSVIGIEMLHGVIYATFYSCAIYLMPLYFPKELATSAQGLLAVVFSGLGPVIGNFFGGIGLQFIGGAGIFGIMAIIQTILIIIYLLDIKRWQGKIKEMLVAETSI